MASDWLRATVLQKLCICNWLQAFMKKDLVLFSRCDSPSTWSRPKCVGLLGISTLIAFVPSFHGHWINELWGIFSELYIDIFHSSIYNTFLVSLEDVQYPNVRRSWCMYSIIKSYSIRVLENIFFSLLFFIL